MYIWIQIADITMWNSESKHFWTGTLPGGKDSINRSVIPLDIQAWYIMAFKDSTSEYSGGMNWAKQIVTL